MMKKIATRRLPYRIFAFTFRVVYLFIRKEKGMPNNLKTIIISRTDGIGDVILTLPICGIIKQHYPDAKILFIGRTYTEPIINCCEHVDGFINADGLTLEKLKNYHADAILHVFPNKLIASLSKQAGIKLRIGTTNRIFHWTTVNRLVILSRKNATIHESQLNCNLLKPLGITLCPSIIGMAKYYGLNKFEPLEERWNAMFDRTKINIILHPKSNKSAREWSLNNYSELIRLLPTKDYKVFISGSKEEGELLKEWITTLPPETIDITGKMTLSQFISFINKSNLLVAASTGPLHIAASCGRVAIGIFPPIKPINPTRWQPIGMMAGYLCVDKKCSACRDNPQQCHCINEITPQQVIEKSENILANIKR